VLINTYLRNHSLAKRRGQLLKLNSEMLGKASRCDPHDEVNCWHPSMFNSFNLWRDGPLLNAAKPSSVTWCRRQYKIRVHLFTDFIDNVTWITFVYPTSRTRILYSSVARNLKPLSVKPGHFLRMMTRSLGQLLVREINTSLSTLLFDKSSSSK
jgi:hypothetical protein